MSPALLTSKDNPIARRIRLVASQSRRAPRDLVVAEGIRVVEEATASEREIEAVLLSQEFGRRQREKALISRWQSRNVRLFRAAGPLLKSVSELLSPQGALALVRVPVLTLRDLTDLPNSLTLCACGIQDPGNLGTLIRTAAAAGVSLVCTTSGTVSARSPKSIRSSAGAFFRIPIAECIRPAEFLSYCRNHGLQSLRSDPRVGAPYSEVDFQKPTAILLGNEAQGVAGKEWSEIPLIRIPMAAGTDSLNVAAAGAVILFEARRQRALSLEHSKKSVVL